MRGHHGPSDRLGAAMLLGAVVGFAIGATVGFGATDLAQPVLSPLVGAIVGVALGWLPFAHGESVRRRRAASDLERAHERFRLEAHVGWVDDIDLTPPPPTRSDRRGGSKRDSPAG